jgi:hypothetical protein
MSTKTGSMIVKGAALALLVGGVFYMGQKFGTSSSQAPSNDKQAVTPTTAKAVPTEPKKTGAWDEKKRIRLSSLNAPMQRQEIDSSGFNLLIPNQPWPIDATLKEIKDYYMAYEKDINGKIDKVIMTSSNASIQKVAGLGTKATLQLAANKANDAYETLGQLRRNLEEAGPEAMHHMLATTVFFQGIVSLRMGENENCVMCRGDSSCILPIQPSAIHTKPRGSTLAIDYFTEYLEVFPDDIEAKWLLNVAHMTLGTYPDKVDPRFVLVLKDFDVEDPTWPKFKDVAEAAGVNRHDQAGGVIMDDFDNDGLLDIFESSFDPKASVRVFRNKGDGTFEDKTKVSDLAEQFGGLQIMQTDFNNDGLLDVFIPRGAWLHDPIRPTLLRNDGDFKFVDITAEAGLIQPVNSNSAQWNDYNLDGWIDLFICCEKQPHRLYKNNGDSTFTEVSEAAGVVPTQATFGKGSTWIDYDNDRYPDLFVNYLDGHPDLFHNNQDGTFTNVTKSMGITGPVDQGFSCWSWDFNNDGWQDIWATCYDRTLGDVVKGLVGMPHNLGSSALYLNEGGKRFRHMTKEAGVDKVFACMGSNFADFNNDGLLDFYLSTGEPALSSLVPNRMFKNIDGTRFQEVTKSSGTGHLQKGHGVAAGDFDRDGDMDFYAQMGGAIDGDMFHNILFKNPGNDFQSVTIKLVGTQSNRSAHGARLKATIGGDQKRVIHRHISSGSSFGGNSLEQIIGLGGASEIEELEVYWPKSDRTQVFKNIAGKRRIVITEDSDALAMAN